MPLDSAPPPSQQALPAVSTNVQIAANLLIATLLITGLYVGQDVVIPLAIAFLVSFVLGPLVTRLVRWGVPRVLSVMIVLLTVGSLLAALGGLMGSQITTLAGELPTYQSTIRTKLEALEEQFSGPSVFDGALRTVDTVQTGVSKAVQGDTPPVDPPQKVEVVNASGGPFETALAILAPALAPLATLGIVIVFVFLILLDRGDMRDRLIRLLGGNLHRSTDTMQEAGARISRYLIMQLVVNLSYGIPLGLGLWLIGVPGWVLWGTLGALMRFIPYVGPLLSAVFPISLAFAVDPSWDMVLWTVGLIVLLELVSNNIIEPLLYGSSTGLSALSLIAAATFWTALWGPVGLILSTPLTVCLLVVGRNLPQLQFLETLLGSTPVLDVPTRIYQRLLADDPQEAFEIVEDEIEEEDLSGFYSRHGLDILRRVTEDYHNTARAEHRLRVANGMDALLEDLHETYPAPALDQAPLRVALLGGKWEVDATACEMLAHALALAGIPSVVRREAVLTSRHIEKLALEEIDVVLISYFSPDPDQAARTYIRRLAARWPGRKILLGLWNAPPEKLDLAHIQSLGAKAVVTSIDEAVGRIQRILTPEEAKQAQVAAAPDNDRQRVERLMASDILDGHAREDLDALAKRAADVFDVRFAVISAIDETREFIIGQSMELPGRLTRDGTDMITMPRREAICDHVVSAGERLVVPDTERDPRFADHPAIQMWHTRFYAGAPLATKEGHVLGALCLLDTEPRKLSEDELELLDTLAADVTALITGDEAVAPPKSPASSSSATLGQVVPD